MKVGIIGAGQLGRMLALAGYPLGLRFVFVDQSEDAPGGQVGDIIVGAFDDPVALERLSEVAEVVTFDVENVPESAVRPVSEKVRFLPPVEALATAQDRLAEKRAFASLHIPTPRFMPVATREALEIAVVQLGLPAVLKTRRLGYDGRGQRFLREHSDLDAAWNAIGGVPMILEEYVPFDAEVSIIGVRRPSGDVRFYPLSENVHVDGILSHSRAPYEEAALQESAERHIRRLMDHLDYAGVLTIEFFVHGGQLLANEMAPRAILDLPLGETNCTGHSGMVNLLGNMPELEEVLSIPGAHFHDYGKEPRPLRKLGHCTVVSKSAEERDKALSSLLGLAGRDA